MNHEGKTVEGKITQHRAGRRGSITVSATLIHELILTDGKAGTVDEVWLDEFHGLRISIGGHEGKWPVSTIKFAQTD